MTAGRDGIDADRGDPSAASPGRTPLRQPPSAIEPAHVPRPARSARRRDVLALAEERLVQRVLERAEVAEVVGPEARRERQRRARLEAREVDLDAPGLRVPVDVVSPVGAKVVAAGHEQRSRSRAKLERQPLHLDLAGILGRLDGVGLEVRVRADHVVVQGELLHGATEYARQVPPDVRQIRLDPDPYVPFRLSQGFRIGDLVIVSGQAAIDEHGGLVGVGDFDAQADQVFRNLQRVLEAGGSSLDRIVKVTIFLTDMANFPKIVELRGRWFTEPYPADTIVEVSALALPELEIEIEAIAVAG